MSTITATSDITLLRRFAEERDQSAFTEITRRYAGMVYAACFRVLQDRQLAEDVAQETFVKLLRRPDAVSVSLGGWLHKAATQLSIDVARSESSRRQRERKHTQRLAELLDEQNSWKEISETVDSAMLELPEEARDLLVQHFILGRSQKDISDDRGVSVATICRRVNDAMEKLRGILLRRGISVSSLGCIISFLCLRGTEAVPATLAQELGKMAMVAHLRSILPIRSTAAKSGMNPFQVKELQLAASVAGAAIIIATAILLALNFSKAQPQPHTPEPFQPATMQAK